MNAGTGRFSGDAEMTVVDALVHVSPGNVSGVYGLANYFHQACYRMSGW